MADEREEKGLLDRMKDFITGGDGHDEHDHADHSEHSEHDGHQHAGQVHETDLGAGASSANRGLGDEELTGESLGGTQAPYGGVRETDSADPNGTLGGAASDETELGSTSDRGTVDRDERGV